MADDLERETTDLLARLVRHDVASAELGRGARCCRDVTKELLG